MSEVSISMTADHTEEALKALAAAKRQALEEMGLVAERYAAEKCPVDTGRLRASISHQVQDEDSVVIGSNVEYAPYVELGTSRTKAQPYLRPAVSQHADEYKAIVQKHLTTA